MSIRYDPVVNRLSDDPRCVSCQMKHCFSCEHKGPPRETPRKSESRPVVKAKETNNQHSLPKKNSNDDKPKKSGCC